MSAERECATELAVLLGTWRSEHGKYTLQGTFDGDSSITFKEETDNGIITGRLNRSENGWWQGALEAFGQLSEPIGYMGQFRVKSLQGREATVHAMHQIRGLFGEWGEEIHSVKIGDTADHINAPPTFDGLWVIRDRRYVIHGPCVIFPDGSAHNVAFHSKTVGTITSGAVSIKAELSEDGSQLTLSNGAVLRKSQGDCYGETGNSMHSAPKSGNRHIEIVANTLAGSEVSLEIAATATLGDLRHLLLERLTTGSSSLVALLLKDQILKEDLDGLPLSKVGVADGSCVSVVFPKAPDLYVFKQPSYDYSDIQVKGSDRKTVTNPNALSVILRCNYGYKVRDHAAVAFGPPIPRSGTAEWCLHVVSRCPDGKINFCLVDKFGIVDLDPHYGELEHVWIGVRGGWDHANETGMLFAGDTRIDLPPFLAGCRISLRLHQGQLSATHVDCQGQNRHAVAQLPDCFGRDGARDKTLRMQLREQMGLGMGVEGHLETLPSDGVWCVVHHYAHSRHSRGDDCFILERVE